MSFISVSFIIPVYNVEKYILECLTSVANQTYLGQMECILVDDCGTDRSIDIAEDFIKHYQGSVEFRILHKDHNEGLSAARNYGLENAKGDYVYFIDSDDYILDYSLSSIVSVLDKYPDSDIILSEYTKLENGELGYTRHLFPGLDYINREVIFSRDIWSDGNLVVEAWNKLIKRSWLIDNKIYFDKGRISEDLIWTFKTIVARPSIAYNHAVTYIYRIREGSITTRFADDTLYKRWIESLVLNYIDMVNIYNAQNIECESLEKHILWTKIDLFSQARIHNCKKEIYAYIIKSIAKINFLPLSKTPLKHICFDILIKAFPYVVIKYYSR